MSKNKQNKNSWEKQSNENLIDYERLVKFLDFNGTLSQFATKEKLSTVTIKRTSSKYNWKQRKSDYIRHKQTIIEQARDEVLAEKTKQTIEDTIAPFEEICVKYIERMLNVVKNPDDIIQAIQPHQLGNSIKIYAGILEKITAIKENMKQIASIKEAKILEIQTVPTDTNIDVKKYLHKHLETLEKNNKRDA